MVNEYNVYTLRLNALGQNTLGQKQTSHRIDPTVLAPGRTSDKGNVRRSFLWSDGPSVGGESDGEGHCRTADGWTEVFTSF